jgi:hypothetical protein
MVYLLVDGSHHGEVVDIDPGLNYLDLIEKQPPLVVNFSESAKPVKCSWNVESYTRRMSGIDGRRYLAINTMSAQEARESAVLLVAALEAPKQSNPL